MSYWDDMNWLLVFGGIADAWLSGFDADGWQLRHGNPAMGSLGILPPEKGGTAATLDDALWLADACAYDHDAPVGVQPAFQGEWGHTLPIDPAGAALVEPVQDGGLTAMSYWQSLNDSHGAAAEIRFGGPYVIRYGLPDTTPPSTNFTERFRGREDRVGLYAMAARQPDSLSEYVCLYRLLEAADRSNGKTFAAEILPAIVSHDFGMLPVIGIDGKYQNAVNAFEVYKTRAAEELARLEREGVDDVPVHLYRIRNSLAHGKTDILSTSRGESFSEAVRALPVVKLLARMAVEP